MSYKNFVSIKIAIIGAGKVGLALAQSLAIAEHDIFIAPKNNDEKVDEYLLYEYENITICTIQEAADISDIVIITTEPDDAREMAYMLDDVRKKVIIDATAVLPQRGADEIHTTAAIKAITGSKEVVRCFNCTGYESLINPFYEGDAIDMFVAGDSKKAKGIASLLARDMGFADCHDFGGDETISLLEDMARCWINLAVNQKMGRKIAFKLVKR